MPQERAAPGYSGPPYLSQNYAAPGYSQQGYPSEADFAAGTSQGYAQAPAQPGPRTSQDYTTPGQAGQAYAGQEYRDPARGAGEYRIPDYSAPARGAAEYRDPARGVPEYPVQEYREPARGLPPEYRVPDYSAPARGAAEYRGQDYADPRGVPQNRGQEYVDPSRGGPEYRVPDYSAPARGVPQYRTQQYRAPDYGPQSYPGHPYPPPVSAPAGQRPGQSYAGPGYASPSQAGQGSAASRARQDPGSSRFAREPAAPGSAAAAPSWQASTVAAGPAATPMGAGMAAAARGAPAPAEDSSAEPLYRVLGGLALRDLTLVESLLELVEQLESREEDPQQLDSLFRVDHLATRMRRNSENLLVLAGQDRESQDFEPVQLLDVARAAVSEIADYDRAQVAPLPGVQVLGVAADDVTHILAELLDNAMSKSPESEEVMIRAERTGDGTLVVSVEDSGIGIPVDRLGEINARLSRPPVVDVAVTRHMGLYVVCRLAHRHGIRVQLRERPYGGIVASVIIPSQLVRNDPDAPRDVPFETGGRLQSLGGAGGSAPQLSIEARGADGLRAQHQGAPPPSARVSSVRDSAGEGSPPPRRVASPAAGPSARTGTGWPVSARQDAGRERPAPPPAAGRERPVPPPAAGRERPAPAPAAGYPDAVPVPRFEPADPAGLPKRKPGALSAANGIPAPLVREELEEKTPVSAGDEPAMESEAQRIRDELSEFQLGQRTARDELSGSASAGSGDQQGGSSIGTGAGTDTGEPAGGASAEAGDNDGA